MYSQILELLGEERAASDVADELDVSVENAVRHCMAVAHIASQRHRDPLVHSAQKVKPLSLS